MKSSSLSVFARPLGALCRLGALLAIAHALTAAAFAAEASAKKTFDVPAGDALVSLKLFAEQCGQEIIYSDAVKGTPTKAIKGDYTPGKALAVMLAGTDLVATQAKSGALAVNRASDPNGSRAAQNAKSSDRPAAQTSPAGNSADKDTLNLTPFEVRASTGGYGGLDSSSITGFRADLAKLPVTADVYTDIFMKDVAATSVEEMVIAYGGAGIQTADAGAAGAFNNSPGDRNGSTSLVLRGAKMSVHRDGFQAAITTTKGLIGATDNFSTDRGEVVHGANSLLYGDSGGGGVVNIVAKQARFNTNPFGSVSYAFDQYGWRRGVFDFGMGNDNVAVRVAGLDSVSAYRRANLGGPSEGKYAQLAFKLPFRSMLRVWGQTITASQNVSTNIGNVNNFLLNPNGTVNSNDARKNLNLRYLVATNQTADLNLMPGLNLNNVDSLRGDWSADHITDGYAGASLETSITPWLSSLVAVVYDDNTSWQPSGAAGLTAPVLPVGGTNTATTFASNPFPGLAAIPINTPGDATSHDHRTGLRASLLADNQFFGGRVHSQTIFGAEVTRQDTHSEGYVYALSDAKGNVVIDPTKLNNGDRGMTVFTGPLWFTVGNGLQANPVLYGNNLSQPISFNPHSQMLTVPDPVTGVLTYYTRVSRRIRDNSQISPTNVEGAVGLNGTLSKQFVESHSYYMANLSQWMDGKLETMLGLRYGDINQANIGASAVNSVATSSATAIRHLGITYAAGVSYEVRPWLHVFTDMATSSNPQLNTQDPYGVPNLSSVGSTPVPDFGVKFGSPNGFVTGSITWVPQNTLRHDAIIIDTSFITAINPTGINLAAGNNGQYSATGLAPNGQLNVDRTSTAVEMALDFKLKKNWRAALKFNSTDGTYLNSVSYNQVYNDQFYANASGVVTYADGSPVLINPTASKATLVTSGGAPLTIALLNNPASAYYAQPNPDSGAIGNSNLLTVMKTVDPVHGSIGTGVTGLPLSAIQYTFTDPNGHHGVITPIEKGDKTIGYYHYTLSFVNKYEFDHGWLNGFGLGNTITAGYQFRSHYYPVADTTNPNANITTVTRELYLRPTVTTFGLIASYQHRIFRHYRFSTQLNVQNMFNHYDILLPPSTTLTPVYNNAVFTTEPRRWIWTNTIAF